MSQVIPSPAELDTIETAAMGFLESQGMDPRLIAVRDLERLMDTSPLAAGKVSESRDEYRRQNGAHFMEMPYQAS